MIDHSKTNTFQKVQKKSTSFVESIVNEDIKKIYSTFNFKILNSQNGNVDTLVYDCLNFFSFIAYEISPIMNNYDETPKLYNVIFCAEKECIIIKSICIQSINVIHKNIKSQSINASLTKYENYESDNDVNQEISSFISHFKNEIQANKFVKFTIRPIIAYIIRRFFYPSNFFEDKTFFSFIKVDKDNKKLDFLKFDKEKILEKVENDMKNYRNSKKIIDFKETDFIKLRLVHRNQYSSFYLVFHIKSMHIFMMKKILNNIEYHKNIDYEISFCRNYSNRCITPFYGFLKDEKSSQIIGFIYEFMSNGNLSQFVKSNFNFDEKWDFMTTLRIVEAIDYLHSNNLIHRDVKPSNILINHDFIPYFSDFDSIKKIDSTTTNLTADYGALKYVSPEQFSNEFYSFQTDVYSFGKLLYFVYEKENLIQTNNINKIVEQIKKLDFPKTKNMPEMIENVCKKCLQTEVNDRPTISQVRIEILNQIKTFNYLQINFLNRIDDVNNSIINQFFIEIYINLYIIEKTKIDEIQLFQLLNLIEKKNISDIFFEVGKLYYEGTQINNDFNKAKEYFEISAKRNNSNAIAYLGIMHQVGQVVEQDYQKAKELYELAAKQNNQYAFCQLGILYYFGHGVDKNYVKAREYFELSAKQNNAHAIVYLGTIYYFGHGVEVNFSKAKELYEISAEQNNSRALNNLGNCYYFGNGVERDYTKARIYYELSAKQNQLGAHINLGIIYKKGQGVVKDYSLSRYHFEICAKEKYPRSLYQLGKFYCKGLGVEQDYKKAREYFELCAQANNYHKALYQLGMMHKNGQGVEQDYKKAREYFEFSAIQKNSKASYQLGVLYYESHDFRKAIHCFIVSEQMNNLNASFYLGLILENGDGAERNLPKAIDYYKKCSKEKHTRSIIQVGTTNSIEEKTLFNNHYYLSNNNLGLIFLTQKNYKNNELAFEYLKEAGLNEYQFGQNSLGLFYQYFSNEIDKAEHMFIRASKNHFSLSEFNLAYLHEIQGKDDFLSHYINAVNYENEQLIFRNQITKDNQLDISKSFVICFTCLKLSNYFQSNNEKQSKEFMLNAIFRPLFCLLFISDCKSYKFDFLTQNVNEKIIIINMKEFIFENPLFQFDKENSTVVKWATNPSSLNNIIEIEIKINEKENERNNNDYINKSKEKIIDNTNNKNEIVDYSQYNNEIMKIFDLFNMQKQFNIVKSQQKNNCILQITSKLNNIQRRLIYPNKLFLIIFNTLMETTYLDGIIKEMKKIIFTAPYSILFGRIFANQNKNIKSKQDANQLFLDGFDINI